MVGLLLTFCLVPGAFYLPLIISFTTPFYLDYTEQKKETSHTNVPKIVTPKRHLRTVICIFYCLADIKQPFTLSDFLVPSFMAEK